MDAATFLATRQEHFMMLLTVDLHTDSYGDTLGAAVDLFDAFETEPDLAFGYVVMPGPILGFPEGTWGFNLDVQLGTDAEPAAEQRAWRVHELVSAALPSATVVPGVVVRNRDRQQALAPLTERAAAYDERTKSA